MKTYSPLNVLKRQRMKEILDARFGGRLLAGTHAQDGGGVCALELMAVARGLPWTSDPEAVRSLDISPINDIMVSGELRTEHILPVMAAYDGSLDWPDERQKAVVRKLVIGVVQQIISALPGLDPEISRKCREADDLATAQAATTIAAAATHFVAQAATTAQVSAAATPAAACAHAESAAAYAAAPAAAYAAACDRAARFAQ